MRSALYLLGTFMVSATVLVAGDADVTNYLLVSNRQGRDILRYNRDTGELVDTLVAAGTAGMGVPYGPPHPSQDPSELNPPAPGWITHYLHSGRPPVTEPERTSTCRPPSRR